MDYDELAALYLQPDPDPGPPPDTGDHPARRLRDAVEPLATHAWWCRPTNERMADLGLSFFPAYVWGRAAALGEPPAAVVVSAFAVFEPAFLAGIYDDGRSTAPREEVLAARAEATAASLATRLADVPAAEVDAVVDVLEPAVAALDGTGRPLFSGLRSLPRPADRYGRLWRACELVREHRGDGHVAVCVAAGLGPVDMTVLTELWLGYELGTYLATRGYGPDDLAAALGRMEAAGLVRPGGGLTPAGRVLRVRIEDATDATSAGVVDALGADLDTVVDRTSVWSSALVAAGAFPSDPRKRAAG